MRGKSVCDDRGELLVRISQCCNPEEKVQLIRDLLGCECKKLTVEGPIWFARGQDIWIGSEVHFAARCEIWDLGRIEIEDNVIFGPGVKLRAEAGQPVRIGRRVWLGEAVQVGPGSVIGENAVVCAGSYVSGEIPAGAVVAGNPPQLIRMVR